MNKKTTITFISLLLSISSQVMAYAPEKGHIPISKVALSAFNQCYPQLAFSLQEQQLILNANSAMDDGESALPEGISPDIDVEFFGQNKRIYNWHFYSDSKASEKHQLLEPKFLGLFPINKDIDQSLTRLQKEATAAISNSTNRQEQLLYIGALLHLLEDMSVPAHVVPVYHSIAFDDKPVSIATWLFGLGDPMFHYADYIKQGHRGQMPLYGFEQQLIVDAIDNIAVDDKALSDYAFSERLAGCNTPPSLPESTPEELIKALAEFTLAQISQPIPGCQGVTWQRFWDGKLTNTDARFFKAYTTADDFPLFGRQGTITSDDGVKACTMQAWDERYFELLTPLHRKALELDLDLLYWAAIQIKAPPL